MLTLDHGEAPTGLAAVLAAAAPTSGTNYVPYVYANR
jgi:hypothetical protein